MAFNKIPVDSRCYETLSRTIKITLGLSTPMHQARCEKRPSGQWHGAVSSLAAYPGSGLFQFISEVQAAPLTLRHQVQPCPQEWANPVRGFRPSLFPRQECWLPTCRETSGRELGRIQKCHFSILSSAEAV